MMMSPGFKEVTEGRGNGNELQLRRLPQVLGPQRDLVDDDDVRVRDPLAHLVDGRSIEHG